jgi:putative endonuclease
MTVSACHAERSEASRFSDSSATPQNGKVLVMLSAAKHLIGRIERLSPWCRMTREKQYYVYIMTNRSRTLYTGVTSNLVRRVYEHKNKLVDGFTKKYNITRLVYYESTNEVRPAIAREKQIKGWLRKRKVALIESMNPEWKDLSEEWM